MEPIIARVHSDAEIETVIASLGRESDSGLIPMPDNFMFEHRAPITLAAARNNVPAVYYLSAFARDGGLLSYGPDYVDIFRRSASYVDRILRGAKPAELPVQLPTKFEMVVNLKTAKALGLTVPQSILLRADEVIEQRYRTRSQAGLLRTRISVINADRIFPLCDRFGSWAALLSYGRRGRTTPTTGPDGALALQGSRASLLTGC
jgi:hypothetical protein